MDGNQAAKESQVLRQLNEAGNAVDRLSTSINKLEDELTPICRDEPQPAAIESPEQPKDLVSRASRVRGIVTDIDNCTARIDRLLETIEV